MRVNVVKHIIIFVCWMCSFGVLHSQQVVAEVDSAHIMIGDQLKYRLQIKNAEAVEDPIADLAKLDTLKAFELVNELDWEKIANENDTYYQKELTITSFDSGFFFFPAIQVNYKKGGQRVGKSTQQIQLAVITPQLDSLNIRPIKGIVEEPVRLEDFYTLFMIVGGLILFGIVGYLLYKRYSNRPEKEIYIPPPLAHEVALEKLQLLKGKELWQNGRLKEYQSELTYIVREYLEERFEIQALESTTDEIVRELKQKDISEDHKFELTEMFRMADMVKFAKATPPVDMQSALLNKAEQFVLNTKKEIIVEPENSTE